MMTDYFAWPVLLFTVSNQGLYHSISKLSLEPQGGSYILGFLSSKDLLLGSIGDGNTCFI